MQEEFALFLEDITERRTKLYLYLDENNLKELGNYMAKNREYLQTTNCLL